MVFLLSQFVRPGGFYHVSRVVYRARRTCAVHGHDFAELFFIESGVGMHTINGRRETIERGDVVLIRPDDEHGFNARRGDGFTMVNVAFACEVVAHIRDRYFDGKPDWPGAGGAMPAAWRLGDADLERLSELSQSLSMESQRRIDLETFLLSAIGLLTAAQAPDVGPQPQWLRDAIARFAEADDMTGGVAQFVELAGKSTEHVNRSVRQCMQQTTTELVNALRLKRAAHLLRMTAEPIVNVAMDSGFDNLGYFYRCFKTRYGTTPRKFRARAHAIAAS